MQSDGDDAEEPSSSDGSSDGWQTEDEDMDEEAAVAHARAAAAAIASNSGKSQGDSTKVSLLRLGPFCAFSCAHVGAVIVHFGMLTGTECWALRGIGTQSV